MQRLGQAVFTAKWRSISDLNDPPVEKRLRNVAKTSV